LRVPLARAACACRLRVPLARTFLLQQHTSFLHNNTHPEKRSGQAQSTMQVKQSSNTHGSADALFTGVLPRWALRVDLRCPLPANQTVPPRIPKGVAESKDREVLD